MVGPPTKMGPLIDDNDNQLGEERVEILTVLVDIKSSSVIYLGQKVKNFGGNVGKLSQDCV